MTKDQLPALAPCPLCGADKGYSLGEGSTYRWWSVQCANCGQEVSEARATYPAETTPRTPAADAAWNAAGAHAQSLRATIAALNAQPSIQDLAAGAHYPLVTAWEHPAPHAEAPRVGSPSVTVQLGGAQSAAPTDLDIHLEDDGDVLIDLMVDGGLFSASINREGSVAWACRFSGRKSHGRTDPLWAAAPVVAGEPTFASVGPQIDPVEQGEKLAQALLDLYESAHAEQRAEPVAWREHYDELKATLKGAHDIMEQLSAAERRIGPLGSHGRGYTHKITAALRHLEALAAVASPPPAAPAAHIHGLTWDHAMPPEVAQWVSAHPPKELAAHPAVPVSGAGSEKHLMLLLAPTLNMLVGDDFKHVMDYGRRVWDAAALSSAPQQNKEQG